MARVLPPEEWARLGVAGMPELFPYMRPEDISVVVVEKDGAIVARLSFLRAPMFEGFWITPEQRGNAGVLRALLKESVKVAAPYPWAFALVDDPHVCDLIERGGGKKTPFAAYVVPIGG